MSEAVQNVTIPAQAEAKVESRSGSGVSWDQLEDAAAAAKPAKKETPKAPKETKPDKPEKDDAKVAGGKEAAEKPEKPAKKAEPKEKGEGKDVEAEKDEKPEAAKPKAKVHKYRSGDKEVEIGGDSIFVVPVDGKMEEATLEDLRSSYSGKQFYDRKITEVGRKEKEVEKTRESLNGLANEVFKRASENPESAYDYLAQLSGKDPIEFKMDLYRKQREEAKQIASMSDDEFEDFLRGKENEWLKGERTERTKRETEDKAKTEEQAQLSQLKEHFGLDDEAYNASFAMAKDYLKKQGHEADPTPQQVVYANRYTTVLDTINETVPHLANHTKFGSIVEDLVTDMLKDPSVTRERIAKVLKETFGNDDDDGTLRRLGRKAQRNAEFDGTQAQPKHDPKKKAPVTFDDL